MKVSKKTADILFHAIDEWKKEKSISDSEAENLKRNIDIVPINWKKIASYALYLAIGCIVFSIGAVIADQWLIDLLVRFFSSSDLGLCIIFSLLACVMFYWGMKLKSKYPTQTLTNEFVILAGAVFTAISVIYFGKLIDTDSGHFSLLLILTAFIYGWLGFVFPSKPIWILSLLTLGAWFGTETGYQSGWAYTFLGMNYPARFVFFGMMIIVGVLLWKKIKPNNPLQHHTYFIGLLYFFISLWLVSIYGNYSDYQLWMTVKQFEMIYWAILSALSCVAALYIGFIKHDLLLQRFGIVFLFLNLLTRYSEYLWDSIHKSLFFIFLAIAFWLIGFHAEKIWNLSFLKPNNDDID